MIKQVSCSQSATKPEPESELFGAGIGADRKWNRSWSLPEPEPEPAEYGTGAGRSRNRCWSEPEQEMQPELFEAETGSGRSLNLSEPDPKPCGAAAGRCMVLVSYGNFKHVAQVLGKL